MDYGDAAIMARALMEQYGLEKWGFDFNTNKKRLGVCFFKKQQIELSMYYVRANELAEIRETILHEIAHALVGHGYHDLSWTRKCIELGIPAKRCGSMGCQLEGNWRGTCPNCKRVYHFHRRPQCLNRYCRHCGLPQGRFLVTKL